MERETSGFNPSVDCGSVTVLIQVNTLLPKNEYGIDTTHNGI
jgi:hypothetical protein